MNVCPQTRGLPWLDMLRIYSHPRPTRRKEPFVKKSHTLYSLSLILAVGCSNDNDEPTPGLDYEQETLLAVKLILQDEMVTLFDAGSALQSQAPSADDNGWSAQDDSDAVETMRQAWKDARIAYERIEGAVAVISPDLDYSLDARYDHAIENAPDDYLFDGSGFTGIHAIERILWADSIPNEVVSFESTLTGYTLAMFPGNSTEADDFQNELVLKFIDDADALLEVFGPLALDTSAAFRGVIGSMEEQLEKVHLAGTGEDESRYAQYTLGDMRANLSGGRDIYTTFQPWLLTLEGGSEADADILAGFARIQSAYDAIPGDAVPEVPEGWNPDAPTAEQLATPYGQLFALLTVECDPDIGTSTVAAMSRAADLLGIPELP